MEIFPEPIKVEDGLYFGKKSHIKSDFLKSANINVVINLTGFDVDSDPELRDAGSMILNISLSDDELMTEELEWGKRKIVNIVDKIRHYKSINGNIFVVCNTGVNKSPVVIGMYMSFIGIDMCTVLTRIREYGIAAGTNLLTNNSFKKILHDRKKPVPSCRCWEPFVYNYRSQENIEGGKNSIVMTLGD